MQNMDMDTVINTNMAGNMDARTFTGMVKIPAAGNAIIVPVTAGRRTRLRIT